MNNATNTAKNAPLPIVSEEVAEALREHYSAILALMSGYGAVIETTPEQADRKVWERVCARGFNALDARQVWVKEQEVAAFRQGVRDALESHLDAARAEKAEYDAAKAGMSEKLAKLLTPFPTYINVPLADVSEVFGEGATAQDMVSKLVKMGYKVAKAANGAYSLRIDLPKSIIGDTTAA